MTQGVVDAWSLDPIGTVTLGDREHPVPPLSLGRFQRLLQSEPQKLAAALLDGAKPKPPTLAERGMARLLRWSVLRRPWLTRWLWGVVEACGLGKRTWAVPAAAPWVRLCVPSVSDEEWAEHGDQRKLAALFVMFAKAHDWELVGDALRFGEPLDQGEVLPTKTEIAAGLLAVAKATNYTIESLSSMRVDGFYLLVETLRSQRPAVEENGTMPDGIGVESDPEALARVNAILEGATRG